MRAAAYIRVSTDQQDTEAQRDSVRRYAAAMGWPVVLSVEDEGKTGRRDRPVHEAFVAAGERREYDIALYSKISRAHRNTAHFVRDWQRLEAAGIRRVYVQDGIDSDGPFAAGIATILAELAEMESVRHGELVRGRAAGKRARAEATGERQRWGRGRLLITRDVEYVLAQRAAYGTPLRALARELGVSHEAVRQIERRGRVA